MRRAWKQVKRNKGAAGIDGLTIEETPSHLREHREGIKEALLRGHYAPQPVLRVDIPKPDGGHRMPGIPTIIDRLLQQAMAQILTPMLDPTFSSSKGLWRLSQTKATNSGLNNTFFKDKGLYSLSDAWV